MAADLSPLGNGNGPCAAGGSGEFLAVAFDCYGTLIDFDERAFPPAIEAWLGRQGVQPVRGAAVWEHWLQAARAFAGEMGYDPHRPLEGPEPPFLTFADAWPRFFLQAFERTGVTGVDPREAVDSLFDALSRAHPYPEVPDVIERLRAAGVKIAVASNADDAHLHSVLERHAIQADVVISSEAVRSYKPRRPFFDALLRTLGLPPEKTLYVGDSPLADVAGARNVGMAAYWVRRYEHSTTAADATWTFADLRAVPAVVGVPGG